MKILAVDDDAGVLQALVAILKSLLGHEVRLAVNGEKAFQIAVENGVDLLITDVVMEPVDGLGLRNELLNRFPGLRTIFISGYDLSEYAEAIGGTPLLAKPLDTAALVAAVEHELAQVPAVEEPAAPEPEPEPPAPAPAPVAVPVARPAGAVPVARPAAAVPVARAATAVPVPRATPAAAVPVASATPRPAIPTAVSKATPAVPVPVPKATPAAVPKAPVAVPKATPASPVAKAPVATPRPAVPTARPATAAAAPAVPTARPASPATPTARPATPAATAVPSARPPVPTATPAARVPVATPKATPAVPRAAPGAMPRAAVAAVPVARAIAAPPTAPEVPAEGPTAPAEVPATPSGAALSLLGQTIGGYQIVSHLGEGSWGPVLAAVQTAINRPVGLKILAAEHAVDPDQKQRFISDARAKANVQHPSILSVYEAGSAEGWVFYTQEFVDGQNLAEMASTGRKIDQPTALKLLRSTVEGMLYFERNTLPHSALHADCLYLGADGQPRLTNLATQHSDRQSSALEEIEVLGRAILAVLPMSPEITAGLRTLLGRTMRGNPSPVGSWAVLLKGIKDLEPKVVPVEAARISAQDRAAVEAVEKARHQQKRAFLLNVGAMVSLLLLATLVAYFVFIRSNERHLTAQIHIPAGDFISGHGVNSHNDEFWIDKYEVTIGQYAKFVDWINANPTQEHMHDHPRQPRMISHIPDNWATYHDRGALSKPVHGVPMSLNSPMLTVSWWDAYAYAKWKGRELPTELEWERAARGTNGAAFPWGEGAEVKRANTNADYVYRQPSQKGAIDGFNYWGDVDEQKSDKSPEGVLGMAGNVSEWTASWDKENRHPILKGGNFTLPLTALGERIADKMPDTREEFIGFRTLTRTKPE